MFPPINNRMFTFFFLFFLCSTQGNDDAKRLYDDLINGYNSLIRPVGNNSDRLTVKMGLRLSQLIDVVSEILVVLLFYATFFVSVI
ncbi:UNVERIFIED_CONTAM: nAChRalpha1 [Trichonephila clavipes]